MRSGESRAWRWAVAGALAARIVVAAGEGEADAAPEGEGPWLREEAVVRGLLFHHDSGHAGRHYMPEIMSGGGGLFDMDGDGDLDAYLVQSGSVTDPGSRPPNKLFRNRGDGTFEDVTAGSGAGDRGYGAGLACGDYDADGDVDLFVTNVGSNRLLRNQGGGRFLDVTDAAGVGHAGWGASAAWLDHDGDGDLDLFVTNYLNWSPETEVECFDDQGRRDYCSPLNYGSPARDALYRNEGDGTFTEVTREAGLAVAFGNGLGVAPGDFDGDGRPDFFVANDGMLDQLWLNQGDGTFRDQAVLWGCAVDQSGKPKAGMGVATGDLDDDGDLELVVCNMINETDSLYLNAGGYFQDQTARSGIAAVSRPFTRFGVVWQDLDNDGRLDMYEANGKVSREGPPGPPEDPFAEVNLLFRGLPGVRFEEVTPRGGTAPPLVATSRAAAHGDVDGDGGVDLLVINRDGPVHLLINQVGAAGRWIRLRVVDGHGAGALGAKVRLETGERTLTREVWTSSSYLACNDPRVHVGLGAEERVEDVCVVWPDGKEECFGAQRAGGEVELRRGGGAGRPPGSAAAG